MNLTTELGTVIKPRQILLSSEAESDLPIWRNGNPARIRIRKRTDCFLAAFVKTPTSITHHHVAIVGDHWELLPPHETNMVVESVPCIQSTTAMPDSSLKTESHPIK